MDKADLALLYETLSDKDIGLRFGVSERCVRAWRRQHGIPSKPRGPRTNPSVPPKVTDDQVAEAVRRVYSVAAVLRHLGLCLTGSAHRSMKERIATLGLDTTHFGSKVVRCIGTLGYRAKTTDECFRKGSGVGSVRLKERGFEAGLLRNECYECGQGPLWRGKPLTLQLDHIDGDRDNNELTNLRILCPQCHSQTRTFAGRNRSRKTPLR